MHLYHNLLTEDDIRSITERVYSILAEDEDQSNSDSPEEPAPEASDNGASTPEASDNEAPAPEASTPEASDNDSDADKEAFKRDMISFLNFDLLDKKIIHYSKIPINYPKDYTIREAIEFLEKNKDNLFVEGDRKASIKTLYFDAFKIVRKKFEGQ